MVASCDVPPSLLPGPLTCNNPTFFQLKLSQHRLHQIELQHEGSHRKLREAKERLVKAKGVATEKLMVRGRGGLPARGGGP